MLSSTDVSQLFAVQQQQFGAANFYAQTIGVSNPALNIGAVGWGAGRGGMQQVPGGMPGVGTPPPVFSYAGGGMLGPGYGPGNRFAGNVMSGMGAAATLGGVGMGMASMFGPMRGIAPLVDPISGFLAAGPRIPLINAAGTGTLMSGLAGAMPALALGAAATMAGGAFIRGGQQQQQISQQLGGFNFINPASRTGMGFSRQDAMDIGTTIRGLANVPEMLTSVEELTRLLPQMRRMGVMQGVRDSAEFGRRFKETVGTLREMSKMLGSTMEEAAQFFEHSRLMGFTGRQAQLQNVLQAQFTSGMTGMTLGQTMGMQAGGAQIARGLGARGRFGAQGVLNIAQRIEAGIESRTLDEGLLADVTGMEGPEAIQAAAGRMYQLSTSFMQSPAGRAVMAGALRKNQQGGYEIDPDVIARLNRREISIEELKAKGMRLGPGAKMAFMGPQGRNLIAQAAGQLDVANVAQMLVGNKGPEAAPLLLDKYFGGQAGEPDISMLMGMGGPGATEEMAGFARLRRREMDIQERTDPARVWQRIKTKIRAGLFGGIEQSGAKLLNYVGQSYDDFIDDLVGRHIVTLSRDGARAFEQAMAGGRGGRGDTALKGMIAAAQGVRLEEAAGLGMSLRRLGFGEHPLVRMTGTTGRSPAEEMQKLEQLTGARGGGLGDLLGQAQAGLLTTQAGRQAAGAMQTLQLNLAMSEEYRKADPARQLEMTREAIASTLGKAIGADLGGGGGERVARYLMAGDVGAVERITGRTLQEHVARLSGTAAGQLLQAGIAGQRERGIKDLTTSVALTTEQNAKFRSALNVLGDPELIERSRMIANIDVTRKKARSDLSSALPKTGDKVRDNSIVRDLVHEVLSSPNEATRSALKMALYSGSREELSKLGYAGLSDTDIEDAMAVLQEAADNPGARTAISQYRGVAALDSMTALHERAGLVGDLIKSASNTEKGLSDSLRKEIGALGTSLQGWDPLAKGEGEVRAGIAQRISSIASQYAKASKIEKAAMAKALGPLAGPVRSLAAGQGALAKESRVTESGLMRLYGLSPEQVEEIVPGLGEAGATGQALNAKLRAQITEGVAGLGFSRAVSPRGGAAVTPEDRLINTLTNIDKSMDKQVTLLTAIVTSTKAGTERYQELLDQARSDSVVREMVPSHTRQ